MYDELSKFAERPQLYAPSTGSLWNNRHISKGMLEAHLHPEWDAASRNHRFIDDSAGWIARLAPPCGFMKLLDLGCGPGLYAERFAASGYKVTGIDFSERSINYAKEQTAISGSKIEYHNQNYLTLDYTEQFNVITMIYCDYAPLQAADRLTLLKIIHRALVPGGMFLFDAFTPKMRKQEGSSWDYNKSGGFFCEQPHICLNRIYQYEDIDKTELRQTIVISDGKIDCYNIWDHFFTKKMLIDEVMPIGFREYMFYGDVAGAEYDDGGDTVCGVFVK